MKVKHNWVMASLLLWVGNAALSKDSGTHSGDARAVGTRHHCSSQDFQNKFGTYTLSDITNTKAAVDYNNRIFRFSAKKPMPLKTPFPLLEAREHYRYETKYPVTQGGLGQPYTVSTIQGWWYSNPKDSVFRMALSQAMLCKEGEFAKTMRSVLADSDAYQLYKKGDGHIERRAKERDEAKIAAQMLALFDEMRLYTSNSNPLIQAFLRAVFDQVEHNEEALLAKKPLGFRKSFKDQLEILYQLSNKDELSQEEKELLEFYSEFSQEPRLSYLLHPLIALYAKASVRSGVVSFDNRAISGAQLQDIERQLKRNLGTDNFNLGWALHPGNLSPLFAVKNGSVRIQIPGLHESMDRALKGFVDGLTQASPKEQQQKIQQMQDRLLTTLTLYDELKHSPSPEFHGVRETILHGLRALTPPDKDSVTSLGDTSLMDARGLRSDRDLLNNLKRKTGFTYDLSALDELYQYDPVLKRVIHALWYPITRYNKSEMEDLEDFLQTGHTTVLFRTILHSPSFRTAVAKELKALGADPQGVELLTELAPKISMSKEQQAKYRAIRTRLIGGIVSKKLSDLADKDKADLIAISLLDELGLDGVTPRDENPSEHPGHYHISSLYSEIILDHFRLKTVAENTKKSIESLEDEMFAHSHRFSNKYTGLTPAIRRTLMYRLNNIALPSEIDPVPSGNQIELLEFAKSTGDGHQSKETETLAQKTLDKLVFSPITTGVMDDFIGDHAGFDAYYYYRGNPPLEKGAKEIASLAEKGFFEKDKFIKLQNQFDRYQTSLTPYREKIARSILDEARAIFEREKKALLREKTETDPLKELKIEALGITHSLLEGLIYNPNDEGLVDTITNELLGYPSNWESALSGQFSPLQLALIKGGFKQLKEAGFRDHLIKSVHADLVALSAAPVAWDNVLKAELPDLSPDEVIWAGVVLNEPRRFEKALKGAVNSILNNPQSSTPVTWRDGIRDYFKKGSFIPTITSMVALDSPYRSQVVETLEHVAREAEERATKSADIHQKNRNEIISAVTDSKGAFKDNKIGFDRVLNAIVIHRDSKLDHKVLNVLNKLGEYNLFIESENRSISFRGSPGLHDWIQQKRFEFGYTDSSRTASGTFNSKDEKYLPINDQTAVKVFRHGDGNYTYEFADVDAVRSELDRNNKILNQRRAEWMRAQSDYKSVGHALKAYFGNAALNVTHPVQAPLSTFGLADTPRAIETSQETKLNESYNKMMEALDWVIQGGEIKSTRGISGVQAGRDYRGLVSEKLDDERKAIESFVTKVEVIHDITVTLISLPAASSLQTMLVKAAWGIKGGGAAARFAARSLLTTAKAARVYRASTLAAGKTGLIFTAIGTTAEAGAMGLDYFVGEGPKLVHQKEQAFKDNPQKWRQYKIAPKVIDFVDNPSNPDKAQLEKYKKAQFEYEIEEAMDPDYDGIPNNHPLMEQKINGKVSPAELAWSPVEQFAGNWKFFQGLNLAKAGIPRGGLVGEMAFATLWAKFHPADPTFDRVMRQERARQEAQRMEKGSTRERSIGEIVLWDIFDGAKEGARFGLAGIPTRYISKRLPPGVTNTVFGTLTFIVSDEATKHTLASVERGKLEWPWENPEWTKEVGHSIAIGSYIGYGMAKGAQTQSYHQKLKHEYLGLGSEKQTRKLGEKPIQDLVKEKFGGSDAQAVLFLRTITPEEIAKASLSVQTDYFRMMKSQSDKALSEIQEFVGKTDREDLKLKSAHLAQIVPALSELSKKATNSGLSVEEAKRLESLRQEKELTLSYLQSAIDPMQEASSKAGRRINGKWGRLLYNVNPSKFSAEKDQKIMEDYAKNGALLHQAIIRLDTVDNYQQPIVLTTAVLSPSSDLAGAKLKAHPKALVALQREAAKDPSVVDKAIGLYQGVEQQHIMPWISGGGSYWANPSGFDGAQSRASKKITKAWEGGSPEEKAELLDVLRIVDPKRAVAIEIKENKKNRETTSQEVP